MNKLLTLMICLAASAITFTVGQPAALAQAAPSRPVAIQDPDLLQAWTRLNEMAEPIRLVNGTITSGHTLAQFALAQGIPVVWDTDNICGGSSCSVHFCSGETCSHHSASRPGAQPIYISLAYQGKPDDLADDLVDTLAHEIYHYSEPVGAVDDTLYEEYLAYSVGARVSGSQWTGSAGDGLQPACLEEWFKENRLLDGYADLKAYPASLVPGVDASSPTCKAGDNQVALASSPSCTLNTDGSAECQFPLEPAPTPDYRLECTTDASGLQSCRTIYLKAEAATTH